MEWPFGGIELSIAELDGAAIVAAASRSAYYWPETAQASELWPIPRRHDGCDPAGGRRAATPLYNVGRLHIGRKRKVAARTQDLADSDSLDDGRAVS